MKQAIQTKFLPATNFRGSRIKAWCERGSITIDTDHAASCPHTEAARALIARFVKEDAARYGSNPQANPWARKLIGGGLPGGGYAFVFAE